MVNVTQKGDRLLLSFKFNRDVIAKVKTIKGYQWHPGIKCWSIPANQKSVLQSKFPGMLNWQTPEIDIDPTIRTCLKAEPFPYQWVGGLTFLPTVGNALLADQMGLGKSFQALIAFIKLYNEGKLKKALVFCPASLKRQWLSEVHKFTYLDGVVISGTKEERQEQWRQAYEGDKHFVFLNYELLFHDYAYVYDFVQEHKDQLVIILDEAQKIKNWKTKTSTMMRGGYINERHNGKTVKVEYPGLQSRYKWLLTGTPMENVPDELFNLFSFMNPKVLGNYFAFRNKYIILGRFKNVIGYKNLHELRSRISPYILRRRAEDVLDSLPSVRHSRYGLEMTELQSTLHEIIRDDLYDLIRRLTDEDDRDVILGRFSLLMSVANCPALLMKSDSRFAAKILSKLSPSESALYESPKIEWILDLMESRLSANPDCKTVIFTKSTTMQELIRDALSSRFKDTCRIYLLNGGMSDKQREDSRTSFWKDGNAFISTDAGATGNNLQCADTLINVDLPWNPATLNQRNGRIRRIGSEFERVNIINLISLNSIDEKIETILYNKQGIFDRVIENSDEDREIIKKMNRSVMRKLVSKGD